MLNEQSEMMGQMGSLKGARSRVRIVCDVMGADKNPDELLAGALAALQDDEELEVYVAAPREIAEAFAAKHERAHALVASEVIEMHEHPAQAVREKKDASIVVAARAVSSGEADGVFSCGSTGAVLTATTLGIGRIKGIKRPSLALAFPGSGKHKTVILDLGANADVRPEFMVQFAHMGRAYSHLVVGVAEPRVGLLSNGSEDEKGSELAKSYFSALKAHASQLNFVGNAEGSDLLRDGFDVVVADGFTGNVALKSVEGAAKFMMGRIKDSLASSAKAKLGALLLKPILKRTAAELSGDDYGGAVLLGLKAPVIKGHGSTTAWGVKNGILSAAAAVRAHLVDEIAASIAR